MSDVYYMVSVTRCETRTEEQEYSSPVSVYQQRIEASELNLRRIINAVNGLWEEKEQ